MTNDTASLPVMSDEDMVEKAARALCRSAGTDPEALRGGVPNWAWRKIDATAVIDALHVREMREAGQRVLDGLNARIDAASARHEPVPLFDGIAELHAALAVFNHQKELTDGD